MTVMATQAIPTILHFSVSYMHRGRKQLDINLHSIEEEELFLVAHKWVAPAAGHFRYSDCVFVR